MHKVWVADDDEAIGLILEESLRNAGFDTKIFSNGEDLLKDLEKDQPDLIITDVQMPGMLGYDVLKHINNNYEDLPVIIMTAFADMQAAVDSFGSGAFEYIPKPFDLDETIKIINRALEEKPKTKGLKKDTKLDIVGESLPMQNVFRSIGKLSNTIATVLIQGESGTGKELIAKSLHKNSPRHDMPFIALNMADIPKELVESELFGHEKGAFTGAVDKRVGRFEQANGGTLFLDEIGDMPLDSQTRLLRVLSNKEFYRVGGDTPIKVDVRIIAATHQNLNNLVSQKEFRLIQNSPLSQPSNDFPIYLRDSETNAIKVYADSLTSNETSLVTCNYVKNPTTPSFAHNSNGLYDSANSVNFELHASEETDLVIKILAMSGIILKDPGLYQIGSAEDVKDIQQEKS